MAFEPLETRRKIDITVTLSRRESIIHDRAGNETATGLEYLAARTREREVLHRSTRSSRRAHARSGRSIADRIDSLGMRARTDLSRTSFYSLITENACDTCELIKSDVLTLCNDYYFQNGNVCELIVNGRN